ncbi:MAG: transposase [Acidobacteria bacterium]|nr:transposase [Acidobacteriota bacterium]
MISANIEERVWSYIASVAKHHGITPIQIGGVETYVRFRRYASTMSSSEGAKALKGDSSYGIRREFEGMSNLLDGKIVTACFPFRTPRSHR